MKGGAVMDERSPEKDAMLYNTHQEYKLNAKEIKAGKIIDARFKEGRPTAALRRGDGLAV